MADSLNVSERLGFLGIDDDVSGSLREQAPVIAKALPEITDELYAHLRRWPALAPMLKDAATIERLKTSQISHWNALFSGVFDNAYFERTRAVGQAHNACGLEPRWYMGAYCFMLERMLPHLLPRRARVAVEPIAAVLRAVFLDMDVAVSSYIQESSTSKLRREMLALCDLLEAEIESSVGAISNQAERMRLGAERLLGVAKFVHETAASVEESATTAIGDIQSVAGATEQLDASSREIASQVAQTTELTRRAVDQSQSADESVRGLTDATGRIDAVVALVEKIAAQTKLLALNATIEAARAGEAGRGFSVVAAEVKALARQTEEAIQTIRGESEMIQSTARATIDLVGHVTEGIGAIAGVAAEVSHAAHQQQAATSEISQSAASAAEQAKLVGAQAQTVLAKADDTGQTAERVRQVASIVSGNIQDLQRRITTILRSSTGGDRRKEERYPVAVKCRVRVGARVLDAHTLDISAGGAHVAATGEHGYEPGGSGVIDFSGIGEIKATIVGVSSAGLHLKFTDVAPEQAQALRQKITDAKVADQPYIEQCQRLASEIKLGFEGALSQRRISRNELFDFDYEPIPNTDPQQYSSKFVLLCDDVIPGIVQPIVDADPKIAFCAPVDRNGYLPTHNRQYSAQQRPGETEWNKAHCRNRRIFDDRTGILAARNRKPALVQVYARDMGVEGVKMLKEIDAPIYVGAETWGNVRLALTL